MRRQLFARVSDAIMETNDTAPEATATRTFEQELKSLLLEAFASGATVEGTWEFAGATDTIPSWTIEITKSAAADTAYEPELIE